MANKSMPELVDMLEIILDYVRNYNLVKEMSKKTDLKEIKVEDIDLSKLRIHHSATKYNNGISKNESHDGCESRDASETKLSDCGASASIPKTHVLFSSIFNNNTGETQTYSLRTERRTKNTCRITITRALAKGSNFNLTLTPPGNLVNFSAGFKSDITITDSHETNIEEELMWSLDSQVNVRSRCCTRAHLVIEEDEYEGQFNVETLLEGRIIVMLHNKKDGTVLAPIMINDIRSVFTKEKGFKAVGASAVTFLSIGHIRSRYGITQRVDLNEQPIS